MGAYVPGQGVTALLQTREPESVCMASTFVFFEDIC